MEYGCLCIFGLVCQLEVVYIRGKKKKLTSVYAIRVTQNVFVGRGIVKVPHKNTIRGNGIERIVAD